VLNNLTNLFNLTSS